MMLNEWRKVIILPIYKNFGNYRGIKLLLHVFKRFEKIIDHRLREIIELISN